MIGKSSLFLWALGVMILAGCQNSQNGANGNRIDSQIFGATDFFYTYFRPKQEYLGLEDLKSGFDSLQLRFWWHFSFSDSADVYVIKKEPREEWSSIRLRFPIDPDLKNFTAKEFTSKRGEEIWEKLNRLGINEYNGMDSVTIGRYCDGEIAVIEIATKSSYRLCSSQCSLAWASGDEAYEVKTATKYLKYLFSEMEFPE